MNNASFFTADRTTHLKIVVVALVASIAVMVVAIAAHTSPPDVASARIQTDGPVVKAGKAVVITRSDTNVVR